MHTIDMTLIEMTLDIMKYAISRVSETEPELGRSRKEEELLELVGETVTKEGIGG